MNLQNNYSLKKFTTVAIGGPAEFFAEVSDGVELQAVLAWAKMHSLPWYVVGEGSNLVPSDQGFAGLILKNDIEKFERRGGKITVGAGNNLLAFIKKLNNSGLSGMERMAGIPGTVGGAIYGCAGAYGQEIKDNLLSVRVFDGKKFVNLTRGQCKFGYRESIFKNKKTWIIIDATFKLEAGKRGELEQISREIIKLRRKKYKPGLKCPGSFFKNIKLSGLSVSARGRFTKKIPPGKITYGKVATGYLLEQVSAKGMSEGKIRVASHHGNLIYNPGGGKARDVKKLAHRLKRLVKNKFGITIEEEVQYI